MYELSHPEKITTRLIVVAVIAFCTVAILLLGCSCSSGPRDSQGSMSEGEGSQPQASSSVNQAFSEGESAYYSALDEIEDAVEKRSSDQPIYVQIGEEIAVTSNLLCTVLSIEPGPYDYRKETPTAKVTVSMRNTSTETVWVKPSNWDADSSSGERIDHMYRVFDQDGSVVAESFGASTRISPGKTFEGAVYFPAETLDDVLYEPHWLVSGENQYVYWVVE